MNRQIFAGLVLASALSVSGCCLTWSSQSHDPRHYHQEPRAEQITWWWRPFWEPRNRIIKIENDTGAWVRVCLNRRRMGNLLGPDGDYVYLVDEDHPTEHRLDFCAYEEPGGAITGSWSVTLGTTTGTSASYSLDGDKLKGGRCSCT